MIYDMVFQRQSFLGLLHIWTFAGSSSVSQFWPSTMLQDPAPSGSWPCHKQNGSWFFWKKSRKIYIKMKLLAFKLSSISPTSQRNFGMIRWALSPSTIRRAFLGFVARITPLGRSSLTHTCRRSPTWTSADREPYKFAHHLAGYSIWLKRNRTTFWKSNQMNLLSNHLSQLLCWSSNVVGVCIHSSCICGELSACSLQCHRICDLRSSILPFFLFEN